MTAAVFDDRPCTLGEGPLWHPLRGALVWFDILACRLLMREGGEARVWEFDEMLSAAGWIDRDRLLLAGERGLSVLSLADGARTPLCPIEADNPATRSNDGRADPQGGFWIGTMGKAAEPGAGAIWRWHRGVLRRLWGGLTIPNAISFAPDGRSATFADSPARKVMRVALDAEGWPVGAPETFVELQPDEGLPDGAVQDAEGRLWLALWGAGAVAAFAPDGRRVATLHFPAPHTTCPAFVGPDLATLVCTSAREGMEAAALAACPTAGMTFAAPAPLGPGRPEPRVQL